MLVLAAKVLGALRGRLHLVHAERPRPAALGAAVAAAGHVAVVRRLGLAEPVYEGVSAVALGGILGGGDREALARARGYAHVVGHLRVRGGESGQRALAAIDDAARGDPGAGCARRAGAGARVRAGDRRRASRGRGSRRRRRAVGEEAERPGAATLRAAVAGARHVAVVCRLRLAEVVRERVAAVALITVLDARDREALALASGLTLGGGHGGVGE